MVRIEFLAVGKELLIGRTLNTNAHWAGRRLALMGTMITRMTTVDDDLVEISTGLREILRRNPDFVVVAGGLGPTPDDMTLKGIALGLSRPLGLSGEALERIKEHYAAIGRADMPLTPARMKMATLPEGATPLENSEGTAPGVRIQGRKTVIFCLPGVPVEMKAIFRRSVEPEIRAKLGRLYRKALRLRIDGVFESDLAPLIGRELLDHPGAYIKSHPRGLRRGRSRIELDIVVVKDHREVAESEAERIAESFVAKTAGKGVSVEFLRGLRRSAT